jgi:single-stranded-DNA-specific exonuclease
MQTQMAELCEKQIIENDLTANKILTIVLDDEFAEMPSEMNGLTATKLANDYGHPVIIGRVNDDGYLRGSMRGLSTIDMPPFKEFLIKSGLFEYVEGHNLAAGASIPYKKLADFHAWANNELKDVDMGSKTYFVDFKVSANAGGLQSIISDMAGLSHLWGQGFPEALLCVENINVNRADISVMGKNADTVKVMHNGVAYMFFKRSVEEVKELTQYSRAKLRVVGTANLNVYYNRVTPQIFVTDYEIEDDRLGF